MPNVILGMDAKLYYGNAGSSATNEMTNVRDVTVSAEAGEADVTTRANSGWRATVATLKEASVEFEMVWDTEDTGFPARLSRRCGARPRVRSTDDGDGLALDRDRQPARPNPSGQRLEAHPHGVAGCRQARRRGSAPSLRVHGRGSHGRRHVAFVVWSLCVVLSKMVPSRRIRSGQRSCPAPGAAGTSPVPAPAP